MAISFDTLNSTKTYTFMGPSSGGTSGAFTYTVEVTLNSSNSTQDYFSFNVTFKLACNQPSYTWSGWSNSEKINLYMNSGSAASTSSDDRIHQVGLPDYPTALALITVFTKENICISKSSSETLYITLQVNNTTGSSITYLPGTVTNSNTISVNITSGLDTMKLYPESAIQNIASAIREVGGGTSTYKVNQMGAAINLLDMPSDNPVDSLINRTISGKLSSSLTSLKDNTFMSCINLTEVNFPNCTIIGSSAFNGCTNLSSISFPACTIIYNYGFSSCTNLVSVNLPRLASTTYGAFSGCKNLASATFPLLSSIGQYTFYYCSRLSWISVPSCEYVGLSAFGNCYWLTLISLPACKSILNAAFSKCYNLLSLYLTNSIVCSLSNANAFTSTPISNYTVSTGGMYGSIFVPQSLLASYKAATNWATYSSRMVAIESIG